ATQVWAIGAVLLGSGAEHLTAEIKKEISTNLVGLAGSVLHHWTKANAALDFDKLRSELTEPEAMQRFAEGNGEVQDIAEIRGLIDSLVELLEYSHLGEPFRRVMHHLCEQARRKVLAVSVEKAGSKQGM